MNPPNKTFVKNSLTKKLYNLISDSETISASERSFWLDNYSILSEEVQLQLSRILTKSEQEMEKEREDHMNRIAEINTKCLSRLGETAKANKHLLNSTSEEVIEEEDFNEDEIIETLREAGEI